MMRNMAENLGKTFEAKMGVSISVVWGGRKKARERRDTGWGAIEG